MDDCFFDWKYNMIMKNDIKTIFLLIEKDVPVYSFYKKHSFHEHGNNVALEKGI